MSSVQRQEVIQPQPCQHQLGNDGNETEGCDRVSRVKDIALFSLDFVSGSTNTVRLFFGSYEDCIAAKEELGVEKSMIYCRGEDKMKGGLLRRGLLVSKFGDLLPNSETLDMELQRLEQFLQFKRYFKGMQVSTNFDMEKPEELAQFADFHIDSETRHELINKIGSVPYLLSKLKPKTADKIFKDLDRVLLECFVRRTGKTDNIDDAMTFKRGYICRLKNRPDSRSFKRKARKLEIDLHDFLLLHRLLSESQIHLEAEKDLPCLTVKDLWGDSQANVRRCAVASSLHIGAFQEIVPVVLDLEHSCHIITHAIESCHSYAQEKRNSDTQVVNEKIGVVWQAVCNGVGAANNLLGLLRSSQNFADWTETSWNDMFTSVQKNTNYAFMSHPGKQGALARAGGGVDCSLAISERRFSNSTIVCLDIPADFRHSCGIEEDETLQLFPKKIEKLILDKLLLYPAAHDSEILSSVKATLESSNDSQRSIPLSRVRNVRLKYGIPKTPGNEPDVDVVNQYLGLGEEVRARRHKAINEISALYTHFSKKISAGAPLVASLTSDGGENPAVLQELFESLVSATRAVEEMTKKVSKLLHHTEPEKTTLLTLSDPNLHRKLHEPPPLMPTSTFAAPSHPFARTDSKRSSSHHSEDTSEMDSNKRSKQTLGSSELFYSNVF